MNNQIRERFLELKVTGQRFTMDPQEKMSKDLQLIHYLKSVIENEEVAEFEDVGFCYWNLSDNYAMTKDGCALKRNHHVFYERIKAENDRYLYWLVCDATQRLTLEIDGYSDFWWTIYREATAHDRGTESYFAEFLPIEQHCTIILNSLIHQKTLNMQRQILKNSFIKQEIYLNIISIT